MATERLTVSIGGMTCAGCVARIEQAMRQQEGVIWANVNFAARQATLTYDPSAFRFRGLSQVINGLGYELHTDLSMDPELAWSLAGRPDSPAVTLWPVTAGVVAALALVGLYLGLVAAVQDWQHAIQLLLDDRWLVGAIALSFGVQVGLYTYLRRVRAVHHRGQCRVVTAAGTGTSSIAMVACCAHHLVDILPILGLSAASVFLNQYRVPFVLLGLGTNLAGIALMLRIIWQVNRPDLEDLRKTAAEAKS